MFGNDDCGIYVDITSGFSEHIFGDKANVIDPQIVQGYCF